MPSSAKEWPGFFVGGYWKRAGPFALRVSAMALLAVYVFWNVVCLASGILPPSLFLAATGLPCPTTGCTRSIISLFHGDLAASLQANAMAVPICILLAASLGWLLRATMARRAPRLPAVVSWAWLAVLVAAWVLKLLGSREYW